MKLRSDIQILRGLAVLIVVLFHMGFQPFKSGFLGVDIFFVISGFLMAVLYKNKDIRGFFTRRAVRLLPAYYTTIIATVVVSFIINTPNETNQVVNQAIFGSTFLSNVGFWSQNSYFSKSEFNPLLHLWSLGVEVQFYLLVPCLAWFFLKSRHFLYIFLIVSLVLCFFVLTVSPKTSFFMMPLRLWEFLLGYTAALLFTENGSVKYSNFRWLGAISLLAIISTLLFEVNGVSLNIIDGHPGLIALLITTSTALILIFGLPNIIETNFFSKGLIVLGDYSYSIYLVHFPVVVLYLSEPFGGTNLTIANSKQLFALVTLTTVLSIALHRLIEVRKYKLSIGKLSALASAFIVFLVISLPWIKNTAISDAERKIFSAFQDRSNYRCGKIKRITRPNSISCELTSASKATEKSIFLVGNSHADSIKTMFTQIASMKGYAVHFVVSNEPLMTGGPNSVAIVGEAELKGIDHIVVHYSPSSITSDNLVELVELAEVKGIRVTLLDPVPTWSVHIPQNMYRQKKGAGISLAQTRETYLAENTKYFSEVEKISNTNFKRISVEKYLCKPNCIYKTQDGVPLYFDQGHLTITGSRMLEDAVHEILDE